MLNKSQEHNENANSAPVLVIVRGWPGSGKSTLVKRLFSGMNHVEADQHLYKKDGAYHYTPGRAQKAHEKCRLSVRRLLMNKENVVVSNTMPSAKALHEYLSIAYKVGAKVAIIECKGEYQNIHSIPNYKIHDLKANFRPVGEALRWAMPVIDGQHLLDVPDADLHVLACARHIDKTHSVLRKSTVGGWPSSQIKQIDAVVKRLPGHIAKNASQDRYGYSSVPEVNIKVAVDNLSIRLRFKREAVNGHASWLLVSVTPPHTGGGGRINSIKSLSTSQQVEERAIRKEETKAIAQALSEENKTLKNRIERARRQRFMLYYRHQSDEKKRLVVDYAWVNEAAQHLRFIGFAEKGTPEDVANELASIVEAISACSMSEGGANLKALAMQRRTEMYKELVPA